MPEPKVTIIVPTFDRPAYFSQALASALAQDYGNLEIVVADNASGPETLKAAEPYLADPRVKYRRNGTNTGMYRNWQDALYNQASGEWALVLSDDDYLTDPAFVSSAMALYAAHPELVLILGDYALLDEASGGLTPVAKDAPEVADGKWWFLNNKRGNIDFLPMLTLFRRGAAPGLKLFDSPDLQACDAADFLRLALHGAVGLVKRPIGVYRVHSGNEVGRFSLEKHLRNLGYLDLACSHAEELKAVTPEELRAWRERLAANYLDYMLRTLCARGDGAGVRQLYREVRANYPFARRLFLRPANALRLATFKFPFLFGLLRAGKRLLEKAGAEKR
jgi:glycosyltransferase involved in cell wall biosynthesis